MATKACGFLEKRVAYLRIEAERRFLSIETVKKV
jgi:hypothetical protein